ncbi:MAG: hypothetical protein LBV22_02175, partial [Mycoplasmataceae bacterium]|nr:hypothetical protein [Mycoplasmataceae bacterium]
TRAQPTHLVKLTPEMRLSYVKRYLAGESALNLGNELVNNGLVMNKESKRNNYLLLSKDL